MRLLFSLILIFSISLSACTKTVRTGLAPGNLAPDFKLKDVQGKYHLLSSYRGKKVLLNFWASWCVPCMEEAPYLEMLYKQANDNLEIIAIAVDDTAEDVKKFIKDHSISFPVLLDDTGNVRSIYKVNGYPESFFIDSEGLIAMLYDPESGIPEARIIGPRAWHEDVFLEQLSK